MNAIQEITSQTSLGASQTAESIGNLALLANDLRRSVADFKLPG
jgi:twitching motility protein PilJ